ncbi:unnamed protein product [Nippostrongylus brasiliensis]|uniref:C2H2-type domain-containing protein n=1 Tax=Nippostrongylus brasiliensis TaxID=27835 RepID=A0A0N4YUP1_NIPBR|nr:unnamed protein product [Nippostrongylus brasiliensis]
MQTRCPLCNETVRGQIQLARHCEILHNDDGFGGKRQDYSIFMKQFASLLEFGKWLDERCEFTSSVFVRVPSAESDIGREVFRLRCSKAGTSRSTSPNDEARASVEQAKFCPCFVNARRRTDGTILAEGCFGHAGHKESPSSLPPGSEEDLHLMSTCAVEHKKATFEDNDDLFIKNEERDDVGLGSSLRSSIDSEARDSLHQSSVPSGSAVSSSSDSILGEGCSSTMEDKEGASDSSSGKIGSATSVKTAQQKIGNITWPRCPVCSEIARSQVALTLHCKKCHEEEESFGKPENLAVITKVFENNEEFEAWLAEQCERTSSSLCRLSTAGFLRMRCKLAEPIKLWPSQKQYKYCSCFVNMRVKNGLVFVRACFGHVGHKTKVPRNCMLASQIEYLKRLLRKSSVDEVYTKLQWENTPDTWLGSVGRSDLRNILAKYEITTKQGAVVHAIDGKSVGNVKALMTETRKDEESSTILFERADLFEDDPLPEESHVFKVKVTPLNGDNWRCELCYSVMVRRKLYKHMQSVHSLREEDIHEVRLQVADSLIQCHGPGKRTLPRCPLCSESVTSLVSFANHCLEFHPNDDSAGEPQDFAIYTSTFDSYYEYEKWLGDECERTSTQLSRLLNDRNGTLIRMSGRVLVQACFGHVGHKIKVPRFRLQPSQTDYLKDLLRENSVNVVFKYLKREHGPNSWQAVITRNDLFNIAKRYGIPDASTHYCYAESLISGVTVTKITFDDENSLYYLETATLLKSIVRTVVLPARAIASNVETKEEISEFDQIRKENSVALRISDELEGAVIRSSTGLKREHLKRSLLGPNEASNTEMPEYQETLRVESEEGDGSPKRPRLQISGVNSGLPRDEPAVVEDCQQRNENYPVFTGEFGIEESEVHLGEPVPAELLMFSEETADRSGIDEALQESYSAAALMHGDEDHNTEINIEEGRI